MSTKPIYDHLNNCSSDLIKDKILSVTRRTFTSMIPVVLRSKQCFRYASTCLPQTAIINSTTSFEF
jgi:hypothetical protein